MPLGMYMLWVRSQIASRGRWMPADQTTSKAESSHVAGTAGSQQRSCYAIMFVFLGVKDDAATDEGLERTMLMAKMIKNHPKLYLFFERS